MALRPGRDRTGEGKEHGKHGTQNQETVEQVMFKKRY